MGRGRDFFSSCKVVYQPIYDIERNVATSYEALIRHNRMPVDELLTIIKENGFTHALFEFVLRESIKVILRHRIEVSINLPPSQLINSLPRIMKSLSSIFYENPAALGKITIEITETEQIYDYESLKLAMDALRKISVKFSADDFGEGHTSFFIINYIKFDNIKIDKKWVSFMDLNDGRKSLLKAIAEFSKLEDIKLIAEGVERIEEFKALSEIGISHIQGFLISQPLDECELKNNKVMQSFTKLTTLT